jgi:hypothetical protein
MIVFFSVNQGLKLSRFPTSEIRADPRCQSCNYGRTARLIFCEILASDVGVGQYDKLSDMCVIGKFICIQQSCSFIVILYLYSA